MESLYNKLVVPYSGGTKRSPREGLDFVLEAQIFVAKDVELSDMAKRTLIASNEVISRYGPAWCNRLMNTYFIGKKDYRLLHWSQEDGQFSEDSNSSHINRPYFVIETPGNGHKHKNK